MKKLLLLLLLLAPIAEAGQALKQSTATQVTLKFVDATNGVDAETGLSVITFDCNLVKHADSGIAVSALTVTAPGGGDNDSAHLADGIYSLELSATQTNTLGRLDLYCQCSGAVPFEAHYDVIAASDPRWDGSNASVADLVSGVFSEPVPGSFVSGSAGYVLSKAKASIVEGTADSGTTTTMVDADRTEIGTDTWKGARIKFTSGNLNGQTREITAFTPASDTITFAPAVTPAVATETYDILPGVTSQQVADTLMLTTYEGTQTFKTFLQYGASALFGKYSSSGGTFNFRDIADTKNRIVYTTTATSRSSVTLSPD